MVKTLANRLAIGLTVSTLWLTSMVSCGLPLTAKQQEEHDEWKRHNEEAKKYREKQKSKEGKKKNPTEGELLSLAGLMGMLTGKPKDAQVGSLLYNLGQMEHDKEVAREGATNVNIYNQNLRSQLPENVVYFNGKFRPAHGYAWVNPDDISDLSVERTDAEGDRLITYNKWVDLDADGSVNRDGYLPGAEIFGLNKRVFNTDEERMSIGFDSRVYMGDVKFRSWTTTGELIGETNVGAEPWQLVYYFIDPKEQDPNKPEFLENMKVAGPGDYIITANTDDGKTYMLNVRITRNENIQTQDK